MAPSSHEEGVQGLYKGAQALALRDGPFFATFLTTYHIICEQLSAPEQTQPEWNVVLLAQGLSGMCGWCVGTPMDLIKAHLHMDWIGERRYRGFSHCIADSAHSEGLGVFLKGLSLNCMQAFPVNMAVFSMYEIAMRLLKHSTYLYLQLFFSMFIIKVGHARISSYFSPLHKVILS